MFKKYPAIITLLLGILLSLMGCSATKPHTLSAMKPASVDLSTTMTKIGVINECNTTAKSSYLTRIEQLLSAKDQQLQKDGIDAAIKGLFNELVKDQRFDTVQLIETKINNSMGLGDLADNIAWDAIKEICDAHGVDAIFSLAYYEADTQVSVKKKTIEEQNMLRQRVKIPGNEITLETLIENGWRIYDPYNQKVIDELVFNDQITSKGRGIDPMDAFYDINDRREAVLDQSKHSGSAYGLRILPQAHEVVREYHVRGSEKFVEAKQLAAEGNWQAAAILWEQETTNEEVKIKAKACYNMAFYNEMNGNFDLAIEWAEKAANLVDNKMSSTYLNALKERMSQNQIVREQLERSNLSASVELE
ncbi:DUF6340 family protein [Maribacter arenosus]|uniref:Tetratricopeptide repeat-containing protein n=1 Tax=Maribacter arenosus TaxID=1854708 RepID=A0ABR7V7B7_9FLAO|nr:DUF6340 family protein [Maribacter arenosus]MBD0849595.1 hypothetical protein [Maribacter arenosus]